MIDIMDEAVINPSKQSSNIFQNNRDVMDHAGHY